MRAAITTVNGKINLDKKNIRSVDIASLRDMVFQHGDYKQVDFVSLKSKRANQNEDVEYFKDFRTTSLLEYDHVYVYNFTENFFGGTILAHVVKQLKELSQHKGQLYYVQTDPELHLKNLAKVIYDRVQGGTKLTFSDDDRLTSDDVTAFSLLNWNLLYNGENIDQYFDSYRRKVKESLRCKIQSYNYISFFEKLYASLPVAPIRDRTLEEREFDLVYYGNWRPERAKQLKRYFVANGLKNYLIGIKPTHIKTEQGIVFERYLEHSILSDEINRSVASIVIGDPTHCTSKVKTARFFENIKSNVVSFIDVSYDSERRLYSDSRLRDHLYVSGISDLKNKLTKIKQRPELFYKILELQRFELERYKNTQL